ncbi:2902_t:CDS:2 [Entrophospora sp. SA101]|nr:2902_t:CDS:2 [Entrophospora sp. SA101]
MASPATGNNSSTNTFTTTSATTVADATIQQAFSNFGQDVGYFMD